jgi:hypothetical protein
LDEEKIVGGVVMSEESDARIGKFTSFVLGRLCGENSNILRENVVFGTKIQSE